VLPHLLLHARPFAPVVVGILDGSDQRNAAKFFRTQLNPILDKLGARLQEQGYDHVIREEERERSAFEAVIDYIARNPEREGLTPAERFRDYKYTGCLVPGYPDLSPFREGFWELFWRLYAALRRDGLVNA